jgi:AraC-like DNA-binding protein
MACSTSTARAGASRTVFARRFRSSDDSVLEVALAVGYESEAAFSRAFKREVGLPPARYRRQERDRSA